ncbi:MAG TPA: ABC transporter substrate-binding protein [Acidisphaera sp.]|nr:ABC transporter substrate-binding protein [Acidisphaera sp.]
MIARLSILATAALVATIGAAQAQKTLYVAGYGGSYETIMRARVIPPFEKAHGLAVSFVAGNSTDTLAKLQAQKDHPDLDVAIMDDGPMQRALQLGFCAKIEPGPNYANLYDLAKMGDAVATGVVATGIGYNADAFAKAGWSPPESWAELAFPKYKGKLAIPGIDNTYGLQTLLMYARMAGGGVDNIDPGFATMQTVAPNVRAFESSPGRMSELFQSGEITIDVWGSARIAALAATGFPVKFVYPKEGAPALFVTACTVKGARDDADGQAFVDWLISPEVQAILAETAFGPTNKEVKLTPEQAKGVPYGPDQIAKLVTFDWAAINAHRDAWTKRWNREVER